MALHDSHPSPRADRQLSFRAAALAPAVGEALTGAALALAARAALPGDWGPLWRPLLPALLGGLLCAFCWAAGASPLLLHCKWCLGRLLVCIAWLQDIRVLHGLRWN